MLNRMMLHLCLETLKRHILDHNHFYYRFYKRSSLVLSVTFLAAQRLRRGVWKWRAAGQLSVRQLRLSKRQVCSQPEKIKLQKKTFYMCTLVSSAVEPLVEGDEGSYQPSW